MPLYGERLRQGLTLFACLVMCQKLANIVRGSVILLIVGTDFRYFDTLR